LDEDGGMKPWYAANARALLENRQKGLTPDAPVVVSLIDGNFGLLTLRVFDDMPAERLEWRMLVNLDVWIWADASVPLGRILLLTERIARVRPKRLCLRFDRPFRFEMPDGSINATDTHDVDVGDGWHLPAIEEVPEQHGFYWCPVNISHTPLGDQLRNALTRTHRLGTFL
jgi:hypothetical protein